MKKDLLYERKNAFGQVSEGTKKEIFDFCEDYKKAITLAKTEREFCSMAYEMLEREGFVRIDGVERLKVGDRVYSTNRGKGIFAAVIGSETVEHGTGIVGAHIDSPRLDLKPNPLYENAVLRRNKEISMV